MSAKPIDHGTRRGYAQHLNRKNRTEPCDACKAANNAYMDSYRVTSGIRAAVKISPETVALLASHAPDDLLDRLMNELGPDRYDAVIRLHVDRELVSA